MRRLDNRGVDVFGGGWALPIVDVAHGLGVSIQRVTWWARNDDLRIECRDGDVWLCGPGGVAMLFGPSSDDVKG